METTILEQVTAARDAVDFSAFTSHDVFCALEKQTLTPVDLAALLSPRLHRIWSPWRSGLKC